MRFREKIRKELRDDHGSGARGTEVGANRYSLPLRRISLAWYLASEGNALSDSDSWLDYYENPRSSAMSSQDVSRLLDIMDYDCMMTFLWIDSGRSTTGLSPMRTPSLKRRLRSTSKYIAKNMPDAELWNMIPT